ncbi:MAG: hypothetical protein K8S54_03480 [Spirochaetia bacterium]|nr:hypothetical protein [Spirochaetia bacterium]
MEKLHRIAYVASLIAGTLIFLPAIGIASMAARPDMAASQKVGQLVGAGLLVGIALIPILAFFLRRAKAGPRLLKIAAFLLTGMAFFFPMTLSMPLGVPIVLLVLALIGTSILSLTLKLRPDIQ